MRLFVDIENKKLVQSLNSDRIAPAPSFMQGDNEPVEIHLLANGTDSLYEDKILNAECEFLRVGIARFKGEPKLLSIICEYEPLENGGVIVNLPLNTVEIESALGNNASLDAFLEIEYSTSAGRIITVLQTACKVKNDLIEDAPNVELEDQFYNKNAVDGIFLAKSGNLAGLENKSEALKNLGAVGKPVAALMPNLSGIMSPSNFTFTDSANYGRAIGGTSSDIVDTFTILATLCTDFSNECQIVKSEQYYGGFITIIDNGARIYYGSYYDYSSGYNAINLYMPLSEAFEFGDKFAATFKDRILRIYKNAKLVGEQEVEEQIFFYPPKYLLGYNGLKKDFAYSNNIALPDSREEGALEVYKYSVEQWADSEPLPASLIFGRNSLSINGYTKTPANIPYSTTAIAPKTFEGVNNALLIYGGTNHTSRSFRLFDNDIKGTICFSGKYRIKFKIYLPTTNTKLKLLRFSATYWMSNAVFEIISLSEGIDAIGWIEPKDEWQEIEIVFAYRAQSHMQILAPTLDFYTTKNSSVFACAGLETDDFFYVASSSIEGLEGLIAYYEGGMISETWNDKSENGHDIPITLRPGLVSYPPDQSNTFVKVVESTKLSYSNSSSSYWNFLSRYALTQIVFTPYGDIPDTSQEAASKQHRLQISFNGGNDWLYNEILPQLKAHVSFNIYPRFGVPEAFTNTWISAIRNLDFGGKFTFIFAKK